MDKFKYIVLYLRNEIHTTPNTYRFTKFLKIEGYEIQYDK